jgi:hypothetical protein
MANQPDFDLTEPTHRVWSLRVAELPFRNGNNEDDFHAFVMLADETDPHNPCVLQELHFVPAKHKEDGLKKEFLGAVAYRNPQRSMADISTVTYDRGTPREMLQVWNKACRAALMIRDIEYSFIPKVNNCRAGAKGVIESLGYVFQPFAEKEKQAGIQTDLISGVGRLPIPPSAGDAVQADYRALQRQLTVPRRE